MTDHNPRGTKSDLFRIPVGVGSSMKGVPGREKGSGKKDSGCGRTDPWKNPGQGPGETRLIKKERLEVAESFRIENWSQCGKGRRPHNSILGKTCGVVRGPSLAMPKDDGTG